jgi:hypothetical protein
MEMLRLRNQFIAEGGKLLDEEGIAAELRGVARGTAEFGHDQNDGTR